MTEEEVIKIIENNNLKNGEFVLLSYKSSTGKKVTFVSRLNLLRENSELRINVGHLIHSSSLEPYITIRRANFFDKIFREYWGNSSDSFPSLFKRS